MYEFKKEDAFRFAQFKGLEYKLIRNQIVFNKCPYCGTFSDKKDKFAINIETGQFHCFRASCGQNGNMITLSRDFDFKISEEMDRYTNRNNFNNKFRKFAAAHFESKDAAIKYCESRGISEAICRKYELTVHKDHDNVLVLPFKDSENELKFIKYRNMTFKKGDKGAKEWCEKDCMPILFGMNHCVNFERLVITEGQMDSLALAEAGIENAVSVPIGCNGFTWMPHCYDWLMKFKEIVVFGDCENGIVTLSETLKTRFGSKVKIVKIESYLGYKDANDILIKEGKEALISAVNDAESVLSSYVKDMSEVVNKDLTKMTKIKTGFRYLDSLLGGGFYEGQVILLSGERGNGKSTLASQFIVEALEQDFNCFMYSAELQPFMAKYWMNKQVSGKGELTNTESDQCDAFYKNRLFVFDNSIIIEDETKDLLNIIQDTSIKKDIKLVVLDNLMTAMDDIGNQDLYRSQSEFVGKLAAMAKKLSLVIILIAHPRKRNGSDFTNDSVSGSADITNRVDAVMSYDRPSEDLGYHRILKITKNRLTGKLGEVQLYFQEESKRISDIVGMFDKDYLAAVKGFYDTDDFPDTIPFD